MKKPIKPSIRVPKKPVKPIPPSKPKQPTKHDIRYININFKQNQEIDLKKAFLEIGIDNILKAKYQKNRICVSILVDYDKEKLKYEEKLVEYHEKYRNYKSNELVKYKEEFNDYTSKLNEQALALDLYNKEMCEYRAHIKEEKRKKKLEKELLENSMYEDAREWI